MKILFAAIAALLVIACNSRSDNATKEIQLENIAAIPSEKDNLGDNQLAADTTAAPQGPQKQKDIPRNTPTTKIDWDKKIIKTATINAEIKDYNVFYNSLREKVRDAGGYIAQEQQDESAYKIENTVTVKVPVDQFDNAVTLLTAGTIKVNERKITSQDVTTEVVDVKSRMEAKKEVRLRYIDLLKQAKNMTEIPSVQAEINGIQEEIESASGRINYLSHASGFSTINFTFYQVLNVAGNEHEEPSFLTRISLSFKAGLQWIGELIVALISIWPAIVILTWIGFMVRKYTRTKIKPVSINS